MPSKGERAPELLRADKEQLERAAVLLGGDEPGFVIVVCAGELVPAALDHLRKQAGVEIPEPAVLKGAEQALGALVGAIAEDTVAKVRSLALGGDAKEALRALNWHREKLLKGAPVVLWLDGVDGLTEMREAAPDAYSFRDMVVLVRGDGGRLPQVPYKEARSILEARRRVKRAKFALERASAYERLSDELRVYGHLVEAENVGRRGLECLPENRYSDDDARIVRARLWSRIAMAASQRGSQARRRQAAQSGLEEIEGLTSERALVALVWLLVVIPGPLRGCDRLSAERAVLLAGGISSNPAVLTQATRAASWVASAMGNVARARKLLAELDVVAVRPINLLFSKVDQAAVEAGAGFMRDAELYFQQGASLAKNGGVVPAEFAIENAKFWLAKGEHNVAERIVHESLSRSEPTYVVHSQAFLGELALARGELTSAQECARAARRNAEQYGLNQEHISGCWLLTQIATEGFDANQLSIPALNRVAVDVEVAEDVSRSLSNNQLPPWYICGFLGFRADLLIRTPRTTEALDLARGALSLARTTCQDLIPETGRALADHLLRASRPDEALAILAEVEPEAISRGMLKELARIRAARVLALVLRNEPPSAVEPALAALRGALESTGAPRIKAETLLDLAIRLPPAATLPDPLALAGETHTLFVEMPMPAKDARSLELGGDVLAARGKPEDAKRRYLMAQGILERRGLGLRLPLLTEKIARVSAPGEKIAGER